MLCRSFTDEESAPSRSKVANRCCILISSGSLLMLPQLACSPPISLQSVSLMLGLLAILRPL
jgi:hypothetical protein